MTKSFLTIAAIILLGGFTKADYAQLDTPTFEAEQVQTEPSIVKGIIIDNKVYPSIELPEVTITAKRSIEHLSKAQIVDGEILPVIVLDEVVITPNNVKS